MSTKNPTEPSRSNPYTTESIVVLSPAEAVRARPGMYVGDVRNGSGLYFLLSEAVASALERGRRERRVAVDVTLHPDGSVTISDDAPPPSVARLRPDDPTDDRTYAEVCVSVLHCGPDMLFALNALSRTFELTVFHDGVRYDARFERGQRTHALAPVGRTERRGTALHALPDDTIFQNVTRCSLHGLVGHLRPLAVSAPNARITVEDRARGVALALEYPRGAADWLEEIGAGSTALFPETIQVRMASPAERRERRSAFAPQWDSPDDAIVDLAVRGGSDSGRLEVLGVLNGVRLSRGTHVRGVHDALWALLREHAPLSRAHIAGCPLTVVVSLTFRRWDYTPSPDVLLSPVARLLVARATERALRPLFAANPSIAQELARRARGVRARAGAAHRAAAARS